jgi:hypothetical protein
MTDRIFDIEVDDAARMEQGEIREQAINALEQGRVVFCPQLPFELKPEEKSFLTPDVTDGKAKNVSYFKDKLSGTNLQGDERKRLTAMMQRYADYAASLVKHLFPAYERHLIQARTSFRPIEVVGRESSYRKDDKRLHVDAFPSTPVDGKRILRVFSNVNPDGRARVWRLGEPFDSVAKHFLPKAKKYCRHLAALLCWVKATKTKRSAYDHYMNQIHNLMKADQHYQETVDQETVHLPSDTTWMVFTDQASHAAMSGQYLLEQSFYLPVEAMQQPELSPFNVLKKLGAY